MTRPRPTAYPRPRIRTTEPALVLVFEELDRRKISMQSLADATGISQWTLRRWRQGGSTVRLSSLQKVVDALGLKFSLTPVVRVEFLPLSCPCESFAKRGA